MDRAQLEDLLTHVVRSGGSSLHLMPSHSPFVRIGDEVMSADAEPTSAQVLSDLLRDFLFEDHKEQLRRGEEVEVVYTSATGDRFRTTVMRQCRGLAAVFRKMPDLVPDFETLGLPPVLGGLTGFRRGLVILTGFFGAGKTTTLASLVDRLNSEGAHHIETVESPIEFLHVSQKSLIHQREVGTHVATPALGVADAQRQGAEIIVVDGLRDLDTVLAIFEAVERGAFVIATMDSGSVVSAIADLARTLPVDDRPMLLFPAGQAAARDRRAEPDPARARQRPRAALRDHDPHTRDRARDPRRSVPRDPGPDPARSRARHADDRSGAAQSPAAQRDRARRGGIPRRGSRVGPRRVAPRDRAFADGLRLPRARAARDQLGWAGAADASGRGLRWNLLRIATPTLRRMSTRKVSSFRVSLPRIAFQTMRNGLVGWNANERP